MPVEVGCRGFVGQSLWRMSKANCECNIRMGFVQEQVKRQNQHPRGFGGRQRKNGLICEDQFQAEHDQLICQCTFGGCRGSAENKTHEEENHLMMELQHPRRT
jgi:hypothetical protein